MASKRYMVYLLKATENKTFHSWLCGGALVTPQHILTSAACLSEAHDTYAIAGYRKYVSFRSIATDQCVNNRKQKIVKTCVPFEYTYDRTNYIEWMKRDVGIAIVEKPYDFNDKTYYIDCDYPPNSIKINYMKGTSIIGMDAVVFGWGHDSRLRMPGDDGEYNSEYMYEASTKIVSKAVCFPPYKGLDEVIRKYMICCDGTGLLDGDGEPIKFKLASRQQSCPDEFTRRDAATGECQVTYDKMPYVYNRTEYIKSMPYYFKRRHPYNDTSSKSKNQKKKKALIQNGRRQRAPGICQNDHGSPLVSWYGSDEMVIGVATSSIHDSHYLCGPPYLYTSTYCTSKFILCAIGEPAYNGRRYCEEMEAEGYKMRVRDMHWDTHHSESSPNNPGKTENDIDSSSVEEFNDTLVQEIESQMNSSSQSPSTASSSLKTETTLNLTDLNKIELITSNISKLYSSALGVGVTSGSISPSTLLVSIISTNNKDKIKDSTIALNNGETSLSNDSISKSLRIKKSSTILSTNAPMSTTSSTILSSLHREQKTRTPELFHSSTFQAIVTPLKPSLPTKVDSVSSESDIAKDVTSTLKGRNRDANVIGSLDSTLIPLQEASIASISSVTSPSAVTSSNKPEKS